MFIPAVREIPHGFLYYAEHGSLNAVGQDIWCGSTLGSSSGRAVSAVCAETERVLHRFFIDGYRQRRIS